MKQVILTAAIAASLLAGCSTVTDTAKAVGNTTKKVMAAPVTAMQNGGQVAANAATSLYPPNAKPGECYARVLTPATYKNTSERVLAKAAGESIDVIPAKYQTVSERVLVREASTKLQVIPETYKTVTKKILVEPAREVLTKVPAKYKTVSEKILVKPAYTTWKKGINPITGSGTPFSTVKKNGGVVSKYDQSTGEIMCLVEVPAEYKTVTKQVIAQPATTRTKTIPAKYSTVTKRVVATPASTKKVTIPAQYKTVKVRKLVTPAKTVKKPIPAQYKTITKRVIASQPKLEWREILCETNTTPNLIRRLQQTLNTKGYKAGKVDGELGRDTLTAVVKYQRDNQLPSGQLTLATLRKLGIQ